MTQIGRMIYEEGHEEGLEEGICVLVQDYVEECFQKDRILEKLERRFGLSPEKALEYYDRYTK